MAVSTETAKIGNKSWKITGTNTGEKASSWAELEYRYKTPHQLLNNRALGIWVWGDGSGALLNLSIVETGGVMRRDHYIDLDFNGWKYFEFSEPEAERVYEYHWPYSVKWPTRHFNYDNVGRINIFLNEIPGNSSVTCYLSPVEALKDKPTTITNPTLSINGESMTFPITLHDEQYIEYWGTGKAKVYDLNNFLLSEIPPVGNAKVKSGNNTISFKCDPEHGNFRVKVSIITMGEALKF